MAAEQRRDRRRLGRHRHLDRRQRRDLRRPRQRLDRRRHRHATRLCGGWGNDLLNADDDLDARQRADLNDAPDTHPTYEDRAYGGAGLDVLIANTGGDRLIDWVGEFNSYLVPFSPFGIATVSRQRAAGADGVPLRARPRPRAPTRRGTTDTGADSEPRNGEPVRRARPRDARRTTASGRTRPAARPTRRPATSPAASATCSRSADFNDGSLRRLRRRQRRLDRHRRRAAGDRGHRSASDAAAVFYADQYLPIYYEISASINGGQADRRLEGQRLRHLRLLQPDRLQVRRHRRLDEQARDRPPQRHRLDRRRQDPAPAHATAVLRPARQRERHHRHGLGRRRQPSSPTPSPAGSSTACPTG